MPRAHVLVCRGPDCASRGADAVYASIAFEVERQGLSDLVVQSQCGCVGPMCGNGPTVCSYPSGVWYGEVSADDAAEIVREDLAAGRPVERLVGERVGAAS